jgi:hypothetical protein
MLRKFAPILVLISTPAFAVDRAYLGAWAPDYGKCNFSGAGPFRITAKGIEGHEFTCTTQRTTSDSAGLLIFLARGRVRATHTTLRFAGKSCPMDTCGRPLRRKHSSTSDASSRGLGPTSGYLDWEGSLRVGGDRVDARRQPLSERGEPQLAQVDEPGLSAGVSTPRGITRETPGTMEQCNADRLVFARRVSPATSNRVRAAQ